MRTFSPWRITSYFLLLLLFSGFSNSNNASASLKDTPTQKSTLPPHHSFLFYDQASLAQTKEKLKNNQAHAIQLASYQQLIKSANHKLGLPSESVTDKTTFVTGKNKHDYISLSRYWWPNPATKDGLPWVRKDGMTNPATQSENVDRPRFGRLSNAISNLSLAYYFTDDERYAAKASERIRVWFLDKETRMNPNLDYAQRVPGYPKGRRAGILDGRLLSEHILDSITLIKHSTSWTKNNDKQFKAWLKEYLSWLIKSDLGKKASLSKNNHGSWYHFQVIAIADYLNKTKIVKKYAKSTQQLISSQIDGNGLQKHELERSKTFFYSAFNLDALTRIATITHKHGINLWSYESPKGGSILNALDYMVSYVNGKSEWPFDYSEQNIAYVLPLVIRAHKALNNDRYTPILNIDPSAPSTYSVLTKNKDDYYRERYLLNNDI